MRQGRKVFALALAALMAATLGVTAPARAGAAVDEKAREARRPKPAAMESTPVVDVAMEPPLAVEPAPTAGPVSWPAAAAATVALPAPGNLKKALVVEGPGTQAGKLPVRVGGPADDAPAGKLSATSPLPNGRTTVAAEVPSKVRVEVLGRAAADKAGVEGVLLSVARADGRAGTGEVGLEVDYAGFGHAVGGNWADRLVVNSMPDCALTTPELPKCRVETPLPTHNDLERRRLVADVAVPAPTVGAGQGNLTGGAAQRALATGAVGVLSVSAGASGSTGTYAATSLAPSGSWQHAGNSGGFSWQYPLRVPPAVAGPSPQLAFSYSSSSVDGRTGSTNAQPSWIGEGFDMNVGFIERSYKSCKDDGHDERGKEKYDLCWAGDKLTMSFGARNGELVKKSSNEWRLKTDDGTKIVRKTGGFNDDNNDEYFVVTTTDGTQFHFGKGKRTAADSTNTNSSWEVPVYGDDADEPCHKDEFKDSRCNQTWRWNLDYVVDVHGNTSTYYWKAETNRYGANRDDVSVGYDRGGYLKRIEYGERKGEENDTRAPAQVVFSVAERCKGDAADCEEKDLDEDSATRWPDVPEDQICDDEDSCEDQWSPAFFTRVRLSEVTTQVLDGGDYRDVDVWGLEHSYPDPADASTPGLWLDAISHIGKGKGGDVTLPKTTFQKVAMDNRVDRDGDDRLPYKKYRIRAIQSESGGIISVNYKKAECTAGEKRDPATNTKRCYPSFWSSQGTAGESEDWFHSYVVDSVIEDDRTSTGVDKVTSYEYEGGVGWHYDDNELAKAKKKTWSQNRGYQKVRTITGADGSVQLETQSTYLRGLDGDRKGESTDDGYKDVAVTATDGTKVSDHNRLQGFLLEQRTLQGVGGPEVSGLVNTPWISDPTATEGSDKAQLTGIAKTVARTTIDGAAKPRTTSITHSYDPYGMLERSSDAGDTAVAGDESCTRNWYARNTGSNLLTLLSRVQTVAKACDDEPSFPADHVADVRTAYDGKDVGEAPDQGDVTRSEQLTSFTGGKANYEKVASSSYDKYGRLRFSRDAKNNETETVYVPASGGPVTGMKVINPLDQTVVSAVDPAWGLVTATTDANDQTTNLQYDGLGRLRKVWLAGRDPKTAVPDIEHTYRVRIDGPVAVTTKTLTPNDTLRVTQALYDGLLRPRQNQEASPKTGRLITSTEYDSRGLAVTQIGPFHNAGAPDIDLVDVGSSTEGVPTRTETVYDGAGRATDEIFVVAGAEKWRTRTSYHGDRVSVDPPAGETPTTAYNNAQGFTTRLLEYKGETPTGDADVTTYSYDKADRLKEVKDQAGNAWSYGYDLLGRQTSSDDPDGGNSKQTYTKLDELETTTDGRGRTLKYTYDTISRPKQLDELVTKDNVTTANKLTTWTYDTAKLGKGRAATSTRWVGGNAYVSAVTEYDVAGRPKSNTVTIPAVENKLAGTYTAAATYRIDGSPDSLTLPKAGDLAEESLRTGYNAYGLPVFLTSGASYVRDTSYTALGEVEQVTLGTSSANKYTWLTYGYERGTRRLNNVMVDREAATGNDANVTYDYDAAGNTKKIIDAPTAAGAKVDVQCFQYDYLRRLKEAWAQGKDGCAAKPAQSALGGPAPYWQSFDYTSSGDRKTEVNHAITTGGTEVRKTYTPYGVGRKPAHAIDKTDVATISGGKTVNTTDTYGYDGGGNMTKRKLGTNPEEEYTWDAEGHLAEIRKGGKTTASFLYDASGQRLIRRDVSGKAVTLYLGDTELRLDTSVADVAKQKVTATRYYSFAGSVVAMRTTAGVTWLAGGQNGTAEIAVTASTSAIAQRRILPFGGVRGSAGAWPGEKGFVGGTIDAVSGLTHLGAREYDPATGRFISVDPVIDFTDPQQLHAYAYGRNNPFAFPDPSGMWWGWSKSGHAALDVLGLVPLAGEPADAINGVWYTVEGNYVDAGLSFVSVIPLYGYVASAAKGAKYIDEAVEAGDAVSDAARAGDKASEAGRTADNVTPPAAPKPNPPPKPAPPAKPKDSPNGTKDAPPGKPDGKKPDGNKPDGKGKSDGDGAGSGGCKSDNSFVPGTQVVLEDGSPKAIEDLVAGEDEVLATDPATGITESKLVEATITGEGTKHLVDVVVDTDGTAGDEQSVIVATDNHPFWVADERVWVDAGVLPVGALLRTAAGTYVQVVSVHQRPATEARVHNLTVADTHTYYVLAGNTPVLVHNCGEGRDLIDGDAQYHIITGNQTGGGHKWPGQPGKTVFPSSWDTDKILDGIADVATNPSSLRTWQTGARGSMYTRAGNPSRVKIEGVHDGVNIRVIFEPANDRIVTAFPIG